jgi:hypothetical protein
MFDPSAAPAGHIWTLVSAVLSFTWDATADARMQNSDTVEHGFTDATASTLSPITLTASGDGTTASSTAVVGPFASATSTPTTVHRPVSGDTTPGTPGQNIPGCEAFFFDPENCVPSYNQYDGLTGSGGSPNYSVNTLVSYSGNGLVTFLVHIPGVAYSVSEVGGGSDVQFASGFSSLRVGGTVSILYTYTDQLIVTGVPEPVSSLLVGSALLGIGIAFRKRKLNA